MNKRQKEVLKAQFESEKATLKHLQKIYEKALEDVTEKMKDFTARIELDENDTAAIYQLKYQKQIQEQLNSVLKGLNDKQYETVEEYLKNSYMDGFVGSMYDLHGQGVPFIFPIDHKQVEKAIHTDTKLTSPLYAALGENVDILKKRIANNLARGISQNSSWREIARNIKGSSRIPISNTMRIARTEGHRIQECAKYDSQKKASENGADIVRQWNAALDSRTRKSHAEVDGQIVGIDEPFTVGGHQGMFPGNIGIAKEDINCRCTVDQRAVWALDEDELEKLNKRAEYFGLDKSKNLEDFKKKYLKASEEKNIIKAIEDDFDIRGNTTKLKGAMSDEDYEEYINILSNHEDPNIRKLYSKYADKIDDVRYEPNSGAYYSPGHNYLQFNYNSGLKYEEIHKYSTLAHEYGHFFDHVINVNVHFKEIEALNKVTMEGLFERTISSSDEFLEAVRKDKEHLKSVLTEEIREHLKKHHGSAGVQDAIDGLFANSRILWGHGEEYYNRKYEDVKYFWYQDVLQTYKELGFDVFNQDKVEIIMRQYEAASEMWANIMSAYINGGKELEFVKEYLPNSYDMMIEMLKGV